MSLGFLGLAFPCPAFAWDGLVRRQLLLPAWPVGAAFGHQALRIRRVGGLLIGMLSLLGTVFFLFAGWALWLLAAKRDCGGEQALTCAGTLARSAQFVGWAWFGMCAVWFGFVWMRLGDPRKRALVYGVWYHQERVARRLARELQAQGLAPLPQDRVYALEEAVLRLMRARGWLVYGDAWMDGGRHRTAVTVPLETMSAEALRQPAFQGADESTRAAIEWLLEYFQTQAQRVQHMSPLHRWWVGWAQKGRLGVYGRRAL